MWKLNIPYIPQSKRHLPIRDKNQYPWGIKFQHLFPFPPHLRSDLGILVWSHHWMANKERHRELLPHVLWGATEGNSLPLCSNISISAFLPFLSFLRGKQSGEWVGDRHSQHLLSTWHSRERDNQCRHCLYWMSVGAFSRLMISVGRLSILGKISMGGWAWDI